MKLLLSAISALPAVLSTAVCLAAQDATRGDHNWWSLQPLRVVQPPTLAEDDGLVHPIDRFVRRRLRANGLQRVIHEILS